MRKKYGVKRISGGIDGAAKNGMIVIGIKKTFPDGHIDTPKALAALDGWATDALEFGGRDVDAPTLAKTCVDALLGVDL